MTHTHSARASTGAANVTACDARMCAQLLGGKHMAEVYVCVTPFSVVALQSHPTKLGVGILRWERSRSCLHGADNTCVSGSCVCPGVQSARK